MLNKRLVILEPRLSGHHTFYLRQIVEGARDRGIQVAVGTAGDWTAHPGLQFLGADEVIGDPLEEPISAPIGTRIDLIDGQRRYWHALKDFSRRHISRSDVIFLPFMDSCLYSIAALGSPFQDHRWAGIGMRITAHHAREGVEGAQTGISAYLRLLALRRVLRTRSLSAFFCIDPLLPEARVLPPKARAKCCFLPDPAPTAQRASRDVALRSLGLDASLKYLLVYGSIAARKGIRELLAIVAQPAFPADLKVLICGKIDKECSRYIEEATAGNDRVRRALIVRNAWMDMDAENALFSGADLVWAAYSDHNSMSGVLVQAGAHGRPVVSTKYGLLGWYTKTQGLGVQVDLRAPEASADCLAQFMRNTEKRLAAGSAAWSAFCGHTEQSFREALFAGLQQKLT